MKASRSKTQTLKFIITGGGTGGHVFPAIAIADALKQLRPDASFLFVGALGKMEMERVPQAGYDIVGLPVAGFQRGFSLTSLRRNLSFPFKLFGSALRAKRIVRRFQPDVVIGTGGYASGPVMRAAQQLGIPTLLQEQNSWPGITNKMLARRVQKICVAYTGMEAFFDPNKLIITGNPIRQDIPGPAKLKTEALAHFGLEAGKKTVYLTGGSLGARTLNEAMVAGKQLLADMPGVQVLWQCGNFYYGQYKDSDTAQLPNVHILPFVDRVDMAYAAADIIVARAGALTISELCLIGKPAILVPSPNVAEDHQTKNALALTQIGAARLVRDVDAATQLIPEIQQLLDNEALAFSLSETISTLAKPRAAHVIAENVLKLVEMPLNPTV